MNNSNFSLAQLTLHYRGLGITVKLQSSKSVAKAVGIATITVLGGLTISNLPSLSQPTPGQKGFYCDTSTGVPVIASTSQGVVCCHCQNSESG